MKKVILRVLLVIFGLNVFTSCYGTPPGDWLETEPLPEQQEQTKTPEQSSDDSNPEESDNSEADCK